MKDENLERLIKDGVVNVGQVLSPEDLRELIRGTDELLAAPSKGSFDQWVAGARNREDYLRGSLYTDVKETGVVDVLGSSARFDTVFETILCHPKVRAIRNGWLGPG